ncbi:hypothetical protein FO519_001048 [Halicephalobus sp. NKZ332]|nr:hypothetical protein FO519_001048 [Halicephalobus sp. NKZ332]
MDRSTVPARIVIVGTSTMKLAERFKRIDQEMASRKPKSFLYDDYMSAGNGGSMYADQIERRGVRSYRDLDSFDDAMEDDAVPRSRMRVAGSRPVRRADPIYGADGAVFETSNRGRRPGGRGRRPHPAYALLEAGSPIRRVARPRVRQEIVEYVTERIPARRPATRVIRRPAVQRVITKIVKRPAFKKGIVKKGKPGGKRNPSDILSKGKNKKTPRVDLKAEDLDTELEAYMKGNKHPRVSAAE